MIMYCVKCKADREVECVETTTIKNRKDDWVEALKGRCSTCGAELIKIISQSKK